MNKAKVTLSTKAKKLPKGTYGIMDVLRELGKESDRATRKKKL